MIGDLIAIKVAQWGGPLMFGYLASALFMPGEAAHFIDTWASSAGHYIQAHFEQKAVK